MTKMKKMISRIEGLFCVGDKSKTKKDVYTISFIAGNTQGDLTIEAYMDGASVDEVRFFLDSIRTGLEHVDPEMYKDTVITNIYKWG